MAVLVVALVAVLALGAAGAIVAGLAGGGTDTAQTADASPPSAGASATDGTLATPDPDASTVAAPDGSTGGSTGGSAGADGGGDAVQVARTPVQPATAPAAVRLQLEQLLGQHSALTTRLTRSRVRGDDDLAEAADAALGANTDDVAAVVEAWSGRPAADAVAPLWQGQVAATFAYARGVATGDDAAAEAARAELGDVTAQLAEALADAAPGGISATDLQTALDRHNSTVLEQVDAYAATEYERAFALQRQAYADLYGTGRALAAGFVDADTEGRDDFDSPETVLQSRLGMLLGEHVDLTVDVTRAGMTGTADFPAAAAALDANTADLASAIEGALGPDEAREFGGLWARQIDALAGYAAAVAAGDAAARDEQAAALQAVADDLARFFSTATGDRLEPATLQPALRQHETVLAGQIDDYDAGNYSDAYARSADAYSGVFALAGQAAPAIGATAAERAPVGGAQTGFGGMADALARATRAASGYSVAH